MVPASVPIPVARQAAMAEKRKNATHGIKNRPSGRLSMERTVKRPANQSGGAAQASRRVSECGMAVVIS